MTGTATGFLLLTPLLPEGEKLLDAAVRIGLAIAVGFVAQWLLFLMVGRLEASRFVPVPEESDPAAARLVVEPLSGPPAVLEIGGACDEGVLIVGSGMSYHNMRALRGGGKVERFQSWIA